MLVLLFVFVFGKDNGNNNNKNSKRWQVNNSWAIATFFLFVCIANLLHGTCLDNCRESR